MKCIDKTVASPRLLTPFVAHGAKDRNAIDRKKCKRTSRGAGHDCAIQRTQRGWTSPRGIATLIVGRRYAPVVLVIPLGIREAERLMSLGGGDGILEVVRPVVALVAEVEPCLRVLVGEEWIVAADVGEALVVNDRALPGFPGFGADRVSG